MAKVMADDETSMAALLSTERNAIGTNGQVRIDTFGLPVWETGDAPRDRRALPKRWCTLEREGPLTIITMNRPEAMNALRSEEHTSELQSLMRISYAVFCLKKKKKKNKT